MTACTNHGGKARRVVTAALVGVLSVGTVPMVALATGANDGIETMAASWATDAKVTEAEDGKGAAFTGDLTKPVSFDLSSGKYLVPTAVTNQNGDTVYLIEDDSLTLKYGVPFLAQSDSWDAASDCWNGLVQDGEYLIDGQGKVVKLTTNQVSADFAASYFAGTLTDKNGKAVNPVAGSYVAIVTDGTDSVTQSFDIVAKDIYAGTYAYYTDGTTSTTDIVYTGAELQKGAIQFALADGTPLTFNVDYDTVVWYRNNGKVDKVQESGDYTAVIKNGAETLVTVSFTVQKFDISKYGAAFVDQIDGSSNAAESVLAAHWGKDSAKDEFLGAVVPSWTAKFQITDITAPSGVKGFDGSYGEYTVTVKAKDNLPNFTGERTYTFSRVNKSLYNEAGVDLYYGAQDVTTSNTVNVNLTDGQSFDASKIKVREADGSPSWSGDQLEVTYYDKDAKKSVDASALAEAGNYTVTVRVKPFQNENDVWFGGTESFDVVVKGNEAYGDNVTFYLDGEVAGTADSLTYDGSDLLQRVSAKVGNPEGGQFELGTDFTFVATKGGEEVDSVVDAGVYEIVVKPITFQWGSGVDEAEYTFTLTVDPMSVDNLNNFGYNGDAIRRNPFTNLYSGYYNNAVAWTGSAVEVPGVEYLASDGETWLSLDPSLYNVVSIKKDGKAVKEAVEPGTYTVTIALSDEAKSNYALKDRTFDFRVVKYAPFDDVKSPAWYASVVADAKFTNVVNGMSGTNMFAPTAEITRADAVCIIFNMAGGDNALSDNMYTEEGGWLTGFSDVDGNAYYAKALAWAHNAGVANGFGGEFRPLDKITREELAAMIANYAKATNNFEASDGSALAGIADASTVSGWATENVAWAVENGIMGNGGYVKATDNITRAEVAAMAMNYAGQF